MGSNRDLQVLFSETNCMCPRVVLWPVASSCKAPLIALTCRFPHCVHAQAHHLYHHNSLISLGQTGLRSGHTEMCFFLKVKGIKSEIHIFERFVRCLHFHTQWRRFGAAQHTDLHPTAGSSASRNSDQTLQLIDWLFTIYFSCLSSVTPA